MSFIVFCHFFTRFCYRFAQRKKCATQSFYLRTLILFVHFFATFSSADLFLPVYARFLPAFFKIIHQQIAHSFLVSFKGILCILSYYSKSRLLHSILLWVSQLVLFPETRGGSIFCHAFRFTDFRSGLTARFIL